MHVTSTPSLKFHAVLFYGNPFSSYGPFETSAPSDPKMTLNTKRLNVPHIHMTTIPGQLPTHPYDNYPLSFPSMARRFRVTGHFETSALNNLR